MKYPILFIEEEQEPYIQKQGAWYYMAVPVQGTDWYQLYTTFKKCDCEFNRWEAKQMGFFNHEKSDLVRLKDLKELRRIDRLTALLLFNMRTD